MTLIFCIDDGGGMLFGGKRQSRDRANHYCRTMNDAWVVAARESEVRVLAIDEVDGFLFLEYRRRRLDGATEKQGGAV